MKSLLTLVVTILFCLNSCRSKIEHAPVQVTLYETVDQSVILPTFVAIDLQSDADETKKNVAVRNYLKDTPSDTLTIEVKTYLNSRAANSLFKYLSPNVEPRKNQGDFAFKQNAILGESLVSDTSKVNYFLKSKFIDTNIRFEWIPSGIALGDADYPLDKKRLMGLVAFSPSGKFLQIDDSLIETIKPGFNLFSCFSRRKEGDKYLIKFSSSAITALDAVFNEDASLLSKAYINGHNYYAPTSKNEIENNASLTVFDKWQ